MRTQSHYSILRITGLLFLTGILLTVPPGIHAQTDPLTEAVFYVS